MTKGYEFFVQESVEKVVEIFRKHGLDVRYDKKTSHQNHAIGFVENGSSGMIMDSNVWRKGLKNGSRSCIEFSDSSRNFKKVRKIIISKLNLVL